jgi:hypothetical protein
VNVPQITVGSPSIDFIVAYVRQASHGIEFPLCVTVIYLSISCIYNKMEILQQKNLLKVINKIYIK